MAAARRGKRTIVCEVAQQERMSSVFHSEGVGYHETEIAEDLFAFSIDPQRALEEYLQLQIRIKPVYDLMFKNRIFTYFAAATPGPARAGHDRKGLGAGAARPAREGGAKYDLVIVDAPATGHGLGILRTPKTFGDIARVGPIKRQADAIYEFITDPSLTSVCAVAWPEEMPVNETLDLQRNLHEELGLDLDRVFMNGLYPELFSDDEAGDSARPPRARGGRRQRRRQRACCGRRCGRRSRSTAAQPRSASSCAACATSPAKTWSSCRSCFARSSTWRRSRNSRT